MHASAPAKLILSGEHAVLHGAPAIACAVDRFCDIRITTDPKLSPGLSILTPAWNHGMSIDHDELKQIHHQWSSLDRSQPSKMSVKEFISAMLGIFLHFFSIDLKQHINIQIESSIPIGSGLGSSAACLTSLLTALSKHFQVNLKQDTLIQLATECENFQHGRSSGLDVKASLYGGCHYYHGDTHQALPVIEQAIHLIHTGQPLSHTAECTHHTREILSKDCGLLTALEDTTKQLKQAMETGKPSHAELSQIIQCNHRLLSQLGIVSPKVNRMIIDIENHEGAAKVSGAGSVRGDASGIVWAIGNPEWLQRIAERYQYRLITLNYCPHGVAYA